MKSVKAKIVGILILMIILIAIITGVLIMQKHILVKYEDTQNAEQQNTVNTITLKNCEEYLMNFNRNLISSYTYDIKNVKSYFLDNNEYYEYGYYAIKSNFDATQYEDENNFENLIFQYDLDGNIMDVGISGMIDTEYFSTVVYNNLIIIDSIFGSYIANEIREIYNGNDNTGEVTKYLETSSGRVEIKSVQSNITVPKLTYIKNKNEQELIEEYVNKMISSGRTDISTIREESKEMFGSYEALDIEKTSYIISVRLVDHNNTKLIHSIICPDEFKDSIDNVLTGHEILDKNSYRKIVYASGAVDINIDTVEIKDSIMIKGYLVYENEHRYFELDIYRDSIRLIINTDHFSDIQDCLDSYKNVINSIFNDVFDNEINKLNIEKHSESIKQGEELISNIELDNSTVKITTTYEIENGFTGIIDINFKE